MYNTDHPNNNSLMTENFISLAIENILLIYNSSSESLHIKDLIYNNEDECEALVSFLTKSNFIETEDEEYIYYLTPETYYYIEEEKLELMIWSSYYEQNEESIHDSIELTEKLLEELEQEAEVSKKQKWVTYVVLVISVIVLGVIKYKSSPKIKPSKTEMEKVIGEEMMDKMKAKTDSILRSMEIKTK
ncbi:MAG: hypothetical protein ACPGYY_03190 [Bacteroidia bacterium]